MKVIWLDKASEDRNRQIDYILERDARAALMQGDLIEQQIDGLAGFPEKGRVGRVEGARELVIAGTPFIVVYRIRQRLARIEILNLLHHAQRWPKTRTTK